MHSIPRKWFLLNTKKDNRSLVQTVVALLAKLQEIEILKKCLFDTNENITNNLGVFALI